MEGTEGLGADQSAEVVEQAMSDILGASDLEAVKAALIPVLSLLADRLRDGRDAIPPVAQEGSDSASRAAASSR